MNACTHDRQWGYDPVAHRIRCFECGRIVTTEQAVIMFNAIRRGSENLLAAAWHEAERWKSLAEEHGWRLIGEPFRGGE